MRGNLGLLQNVVVSHFSALRGYFDSISLTPAIYFVRGFAPKMAVKPTVHWFESPIYNNFFMIKFPHCAGLLPKIA